MAYTGAVFFVDYEGGSDAARTALTTCVISNPSGSIIQVAKTAHGLVVGAIVDATLFTAWFNDAWKVSVVVDADNFQVEGTWQAAADANGTITPRGGSSKADAWKTLTTGASAVRIQPGDTIRTMGSPTPTSLGVTGVWTDGPLAATQAITSSTNATPIVVTRASHGYANGDTVIVNGHTTNTNANGTWTVANQTANTFELANSVGNGVGGASGTVRNINNGAVNLSGAVTKNVALPRDGETGGQGSKTNWTASANVTTSITTADFKQGGESLSVAIAAAFTTGLAAYRALAVLTDLSAYQQLTFWIKQTAGTIGTAGAVRLRLCTDTVGAVPVDSFDVPALGALNQWFPVTFNKGSALSAIAQSISFDVVTDNGAQTFLIDNIVAVKSVASADSLSLQSLIGKNTAGESWLAIQSIVGTRVMLDQHNNSIPSSSPQRGYSGSTETVTTYKREPLNVPPAATSTAVQSDFRFIDDGAQDNQITYSFGWDRTNMTTQNLETWLSGQNGFGRGVGDSSSARLFIAIAGILGCVRFDVGVGSIADSMWAFGTLHVNNNTTNGLLVGSTHQSTGAVKSARNNGSHGVQFSGDRNAFAEINAAHGNIGSGLLFNGASYNVIDDASLKNNSASGVNLLAGAAENRIKSLVTSGNGAGITAGASAAANVAGVLYLKNASIGEAAEVTIQSYRDAQVISENHDLIAGNTQIFHDGGIVSSETTVRHTASGLAWALAVTSTRRTVNRPLSLDVAKVAVAANALVTVKIWMRRTDTGMTFRLMCKGGQIAGVSADSFTAMTAAANTYEEVTLTFTPTEAGVVVLSVEAYGGTTFIGYCDDFSITQA